MNIPLLDDLVKWVSVRGAIGKAKGRMPEEPGPLVVGSKGWLFGGGVHSCAGRV